MQQLRQRRGTAAGKQQFYSLCLTLPPVQHPYFCLLPPPLHILKREGNTGITHGQGIEVLVSISYKTRIIPWISEIFSDITPAASR